MLVLGMLSVSWCWEEEAAEIAKQKANMAAGEMDDAKEKTASWTDWIAGKFSE